eukprot:6211716-Pleurochrysis_carterae.AAC.2
MSSEGSVSLVRAWLVAVNWNVCAAHGGRTLTPTGRPAVIAGRKGRNPKLVVRACANLGPELRVGSSEGSRHDVHVVLLRLVWLRQRDGRQQTRGRESVAARPMQARVTELSAGEPQNSTSGRPHLYSQDQAYPQKHHRREACCTGPRESRKASCYSTRAIHKRHERNARGVSREKHRLSRGAKTAAGIRIVFTMTHGT